MRKDYKPLTGRSKDMRHSTNLVDSKSVVKNGYDYNLQVWVINYIILPCGHPESMGPDCCNAKRLAWQDIRDLHESH